MTARAGVGVTVEVGWVAAASAVVKAAAQAGQAA